ncbi:unnamed protein product, partial [Schistosoma mattheei]
MLSPWVSGVLSELSQKLGMIADIWNAMGLEGENLRLRIHSLSSHLFLMLDEMYSEEILAKQSIIDSIKELKVHSSFINLHYIAQVKIKELESELGLTNNISETSSLVMTEKLFYDHFKALTEKSSSILQTYNLLKEEEKDLCARLDEPSVPETFIHVPNTEQIRILKENIDHLTLEKVTNVCVIDLLQQKTIDDEEIITLVTAPNPMENLSLSKNFLDHVTKLRNSLAQEFVKLDDDCQRIIKEIMHIAGRLNIDNGVNIQQPVSARFLQHDWVASIPELMIGGGVVERVGRFTYLGSLISPCGLACDEVSARIQKARLAFANLHHFWRRRDIRLSIKGRVYCAAVRSVPLYGSETWPVRVEDIRRLLVFDHRCLRNIARISWDHR